MKQEVLVKVEGLSKKFCKDLKRSLWYGFQELNPLKKHNAQQELRKDEFWAVKDISFELRRGECLGLIGHNGAGKSTLLKMLNGLINPDEGKITIKGKVGALIELGAGFNPILTGRENIFNNGAVLGFSKEEIDAKVEEIIAFAELEEFIDMPVQNYSSGMRVRLGFAVAAQLEPDVLIIDEVLAVGDIGFRVKCLNRISELINNCAVIFVSHSMPQVAKIATKVMLLDRGIIEIFTSNIANAAQKYLSRFAMEESSVLGSGEVEIIDVKILDALGKTEDNSFICSRKENLKFKLILNFKASVKKYIISLVFLDIELKPVASIVSNSDDSFFIKNDDVKEYIFSTDNVFAPGRYTINYAVIELTDNNTIGKTYCNYQNLNSIFIKDSGSFTYVPIQLKALWK